MAVVRPVPAKGQQSVPQIPPPFFVLEEGLGKGGGVGKVVTGSCHWQNDTTCLLSHAGHHLVSPRRAKGRVQNRWAKDKGTAEGTLDVGQDRKSQPTLDKGMSDTQMKRD